MLILIVLGWLLFQSCYQQEDLIRLSNALLSSSFGSASFFFGYWPGCWMDGRKMS
jgi:hypothetical protein